MQCYLLTIPNSPTRLLKRRMQLRSEFLTRHSTTSELNPWEQVSRLVYFRWLQIRDNEGIMREGVRWFTFVSLHLTARNFRVWERSMWFRHRDKNSEVVAERAERMSNFLSRSSLESSAKSFHSLRCFAARREFSSRHPRSILRMSREKNPQSQFSYR